MQQKEEINERDMLGNALIFLERVPTTGLQEALALTQTHKAIADALAALDAPSSGRKSVDGDIL